METTSFELQRIETQTPHVQEPTAAQVSKTDVKRYSVVIKAGGKQIRVRVNTKLLMQQHAFEQANESISNRSQG
jgi:hypothetical protein